MSFVSGLQAAKDWLKSLPTRDMETVDCGSWTLNESQIAEVWSAVQQLKVSMCLHMHTA